MLEKTKKWISAAAIICGVGLRGIAVAAPGDPDGPIVALDTGSADGVSHRFVSSSAIGMDGAGGSVVTWIRADDNLTPGQFLRTYSLVGQRLAPDGARLGSEFIVTTARADGGLLSTLPFVQALVPDGTLQDPLVSMNASGQFIVVWTEYNGVHVRGYDASALPTTSEIIIRQSAGADDPHAVIAADGSFAVSWIGRQTTNIGFSSEVLLLPNIPFVETSVVHVLRFDPNGRRLDSRWIDSSGHISVSYRADSIIDRYLGRGATSETIGDARMVIDDSGNLSIGYLRSTSRTDCDFDLATYSDRQVSLDPTGRRKSPAISKVCAYDIGVDRDGRRVVVHPGDASYIVHRIPRPGTGIEVVTSIPAAKIDDINIGVRPDGDFILVVGSQQFALGSTTVQVIGSAGQSISSPIPFVLDGRGPVKASCRAAASAAKAYVVACAVSDYVQGQALNGIYVQRYAAE